MNAIIKPYLYGLLSAVVVGLGLWLAIPLLFWSIKETIGIWYFGSLYVLPLLVGGYLAASNTRSRYRSRKLLVGMLVGLSFVMLHYLVSSISGEAWFVLAFNAAGVCVSIIGAFFGSLKRRRI